VPRKHLSSRRRVTAWRVPSDLLNVGHEHTTCSHVPHPQHTAINLVGNHYPGHSENHCNGVGIMMSITTTTQWTQIPQLDAAYTIAWCCHCDLDLLQMVADGMHNCLFQLSLPCFCFLVIWCVCYSATLVTISYMSTTLNHSTQLLGVILV